MAEKLVSGGMISWEVFDALYEHHFDCLRKIRFFVKAGSGLREEGTALEIITEFLTQKESELQELRRNALAERDKAQSLGAKGSPSSQENKVSPESIRQEDRAVFGRLREICASGGDEWENLRTYADSVYAILKKRQEEDPRSCPRS
jgi:hypothetical protein